MIFSIPSVRAVSCGLCFCVALLSGSSSASKKTKGEIDPARIPQWVHDAVRRDDPKLGAGLVILHDERIVEPLLAGGIRATRRLVARAGNVSAVEALRDFPLYYSTGDEVESVRGWTLDTEGTAHEAHPDRDVDDVTGSTSASGIDDSRIRIVHPPGLRVGGIAAYESVVVKQLDTGATSYEFGTTDNYTAFSRITVRVPESWNIEIATRESDEVEIDRTDREIVATANDLRALPDEPSRPPDSAVLPLIWVRWWNPDGSRGYESWDAVAAWFGELTEGVLEDRGEAERIAARDAPTEPARLLDSLARSFEYASRAIRYVAIDIGLGLGVGYKPATPATVCSKRFGDCKDKAFLMRSIVGSWGLEHYAVLVRTRDLGPVLPEIPTPSQFNHCIAAVVLPTGVGADLWPTLEVAGVGRILLVDATSRYNSPFDLPDADQGTTALLVHGEHASLIDLPIQPPGAARIDRKIVARVANDGTMIDAQTVESWTGTEAANVRYSCTALTDAEQRDRSLRALQSRFPGAELTDYAIEGLDQFQSPVRRTLTIAGGRLGKRVGDLLIIESQNLTYGLEFGSLPAPPRRWPYEVGLPVEETVEVSLQFDPGWVPEDLPRDVSVESAELTFESHWTFDDDRLVHHRQMRRRVASISVEEYAKFRERVATVRGSRSQGLVFIKP